jgi:hypothetical protein
MARAGRLPHKAGKRGRRRCLLTLHLLRGAASTSWSLTTTLTGKVEKRRRGGSA